MMACRSCTFSRKGENAWSCNHFWEGIWGGCGNYNEKNHLAEIPPEVWEWAKEELIVELCYPEEGLNDGHNR